ncbi:MULTISPECIES: DUF6752 domain-containing protein [Cellulosimicrobium]|uniref:DUF6752 domain-containing protein n=1 Tax=Cellulosimicrobium TaxID=157920 RepID=UPI0011A014B0|nr:MULTISPECIES: DUF6752 domain-containing protein [Cellulosimicrobium]MBE9937670.1 hypothetical protein [Cellulosimicrobium cellulans]
MKQQIIRLGDKLAPSVMQRIRTPRNADVLEELARLRDEVRELRAEIDECRRDNVRIAELTDIVESRLAGRPMSS